MCSGRCAATAALAAVLRSVKSPPMCQNNGLRPWATSRSPRGNGGNARARTNQQTGLLLSACRALIGDWGFWRGTGEGEGEGSGMAGGLTCATSTRELLAQGRARKGR